MLIANPIYDVVFKYLMEDRDIARGLLAHIINEEIVELDFAAQEHTAEHDDRKLTFYRLDFKAKIRTGESDYKNVLIELQKARLVSDVERFRNYIGNQYRRIDEIPGTDGQPVKQSLPIITIFFLGHELSKDLPASLKITRQYADLITGESVSLRHDFVEKLSHDMYVVQIPSLPEENRNELEELLCVFCQDHPADENGHALVIDEDKPHCELTKKILRKLNKLVEKPKVRKQMDVEDEMFRMLEAELEKETRELLAELKKAKDNELKAKDNEQKTTAKMRKLLEELGYSDAQIKQKLSEL